jgi:hypothetical protein
MHKLPDGVVYVTSSLSRSRIEEYDDDDDSIRLIDSTTIDSFVGSNFRSELEIGIKSTN